MWMHPPFVSGRHGPANGKKKRGLAPTSPLDRWGPVGLGLATYRTRQVYPNPPWISGGRSARTGRGRPGGQRRRSGSSVREDLLAGLLDLHRADPVVELGEVPVHLGVAAIRVPGDRPSPAVLLVESGHQLGHGDVAELRVLLEQVLELAGQT